MDKAQPPVTEEEDTIVLCLRRVGKSVGWLRLFENTEVTIGRGMDVTYQLVSPNCPLMISRLHCMFKQREDGQWTVTDRKSMNGVRVNRLRIVVETPYLLQPGDQIELGIPVTGDLAEFNYTLVQSPLKDVKLCLAKPHTDLTQTVHHFKKLKRKMAEETEPSTSSKPKLYRSFGTDKSSAQACPLLPVHPERKCKQNSQLCRINIKAIVEADKDEADNAEADNAEVDKAEADKAEADKAEVENAEVDNAEVDKAEVDKAEVDKAEVDKAEVDKAEADKAEADKAEADKAEADKAEVDKAEVDKAEVDNAEVENAEADNAEVDNAEVDNAEVDNAADMDNLQMYSQNILMLKEQVVSTERQVDLLERQPKQSAPHREDQIRELQTLRAKVNKMEALEKSFNEAKRELEEQKTQQQEEQLKKQLDNALHEQKKVIDELSLSRKELEVTKKKARAQRHRMVTQVTELLENELQCVICSELFIEAVILNCAHGFCLRCIQQWRKKKEECPVCRQAIHSQTRCLALDNYIDSVVQNLSLEMKTRRQQLINERKGVVLPDVVVVVISDEESSVTGETSGLGAEEDDLVLMVISPSSSPETLDSEDEDA